MAKNAAPSFFKLDGISFQEREKKGSEGEIKSRTNYSSMYNNMNSYLLH